MDLATGVRPPWLGGHPHINFRVPQELHPQIWMLLGAAQAKSEHIARTPIRPEVQKQLHELYLAKGVMATTAIEGNPLSEEQVQGILNGNLRLPPSQEYLEQEVRNIADACNDILGHAFRSDPQQLSVRLIRDFNRAVLRDLEPEADEVPGEYAPTARVVGRYKAPSPEFADDLLGQLCRWLDEGFRAVIPGHEISVAILKAMFAHLYLAWIHPFGNGNGRTARLIEYLLLVNAGVPSPSAHLLSNHYNLTRAEYYRQLDLSSARQDPQTFLLYAAQGLVDGLREQLGDIQSAQWETTWESWVHGVFRDRKTLTGRRQRELVLALGRRSEPIAKSRLPELSPRLVEAYSGLQEKAVTRDVNVLLELGLIVRVRGGYTTRRDALVDFRAFSAELPI